MAQNLANPPPLDAVSQKCRLRALFPTVYPEPKQCSMAAHVLCTQRSTFSRREIRATGKGCPTERAAICARAIKLVPLRIASGRFPKFLDASAALPSKRVLSAARAGRAAPASRLVVHMGSSPCDQQHYYVTALPYVIQPLIYRRKNNTLSNILLEYCTKFIM